jgi:hypothetical protein
MNNWNQLISYNINTHIQNNLTMTKHIRGLNILWSALNDVRFQADVRIERTDPHSLELCGSIIISVPSTTSTIHTVRLTPLLTLSYSTPSTDSLRKPVIYSPLRWRPGNSTDGTQYSARSNNAVVHTRLARPSIKLWCRSVDWRTRTLLTDWTDRLYRIGKRRVI